MGGLPQKNDPSARGDAKFKLGLALVFLIVTYVCINLYLAPKALVIPQVNDLPSRLEPGEREPSAMISHEEPPSAVISPAEPAVVRSPPVEQTIGDDARTNVKTRPFMRSVANAYMNRILDIERARDKIDEKCTRWGGSEYLQGISSRSHDIITSKTSSIKRLGGVGDGTESFFIAQNVSISIHMSGEFETKKGKLPQLTMHYSGSTVNSYPSNKKGSVLDQMKFDSSGVGECDHFLEYPVMLVDSNIDSWNWWFFLQSVLHHFVMVTVLQSEVTGDYYQDSMRTLHLTDNVNYERSFLDAFDILFSGRRGKDSRQVWKIHPGHDPSKRICFRRVIWGPNFSAGSRLLKNKKHQFDKCFSSVIYAYSSFLKAGLNILPVPRPNKPRVLWVGRDMSAEANWNSWQKQRVISNQDEVIKHLKEKCSQIGIELDVAQFYGSRGKYTPFEEQALFVSRADILIGIHGAGLNMFHFLPFNSVVIELHKGTVMNKNSENYVNHIKEGAYLTMSVSASARSLDLGKTWGILEQGIRKWSQLVPSQSTAP